MTSEFGNTTMRPRARLIGLIGEELISDEPVALVELVKNAYDADATIAHIEFIGDSAETPDKIVVTDNGTGMDLNTVLHAWLEPGTDSKRKRDKSARGRILQGAKGIGRFAAARLAETLLLESKTQPGQPGVRVLIDWGAFDEESYLDEVSVNWEIADIATLDVGTRLTMTGIRKTWSADDYIELHARLSRLVSPFDDVADFQIILDTADDEYSGEVQSPELVLQPKYWLRGEVDSEGFFSGEFLLDGSLVESFSEKKLAGQDTKPICGPFGVDIRAWDRERESLQPIAEKYGVGIQEIRRTLNYYCGVSIYRDGFRVHPYGQSGNDWLKLDNRSRQNPPHNLANNQIIAAVRISREDNPRLQDRSTREGMVINREHIALERWFIEVLAILEDLRYDIRPRKSRTPAETEPIFEGFELTEFLEFARDSLGGDHPVYQRFEDAERQVKSAVERVQELFSRLLQLAGLGHMVDIVVHEIGAPLGKVSRQIPLLEKSICGHMDPESAETVSDQLLQMKAWLEQIYNLRQRLEPQTPGKRGKASKFDACEEIEDNFALHEALLKKQGICYAVNSTVRPLDVFMSRAALGQILANLIDNALFWIIRQKGVGKGGEIRVDVLETDGGFRMLFRDDGPGISEADRERIFEPYFTRKPYGSGLGLYIARLVMEPYGKLVYRADSDLPGACFEAIFEKGVGR